MPDLKKIFSGAFRAQDEAEDPSKGNPYYLHKVAVWKRVRLYLTVFLAVFLLSFTLFNLRFLRLEHFTYFFSDFRSSVRASSYEAISMEYVADGRQSFATFRGGLCVVGTHNVAVFTKNSRRLITDSVNLSNPAVATSDKNILVYDRGSYTFLVYNSYERILVETLDEPILYGAVSNRGEVAIVTLGRDNVSYVYYYDSGMKKSARIRKNTYVTQALFGPSSSSLVIACVDGKDGQFDMSIEKYGLSGILSSSPEYSVRYSDCFPLYVSYDSGKYLNVICDKAFIALDGSGREKVNYHFSSRLVAGSTGEYGAALAFDADLVTGEVRLMYWSPDGRPVFDGKVKAGVEQILLDKGCVYLKGEHITRFSLTDHKTETDVRNVAGMTLFPASGGELIACSPASASFIHFGEEGTIRNQ